ncbi:cytidylate kinase [Psittacicella hinzii]|uniref:Cytidylate kinase n=1 Tax=Psittacicella hinzii TaxID=2028575 RepID=A0A3A1Y9J4_9GAMM|nr:(d)CMP kinase [Psittacicella hinzii]RIY33996.1 cytidylate kinase [Psittacicella hinzii]
MQKFVITIDGTSGVGKGTMAGLIAQKYNCVRLDSGAIYRSAAIYLKDLDYNLEQDPKDPVKLVKIVELLTNLPLEFKDEDGVLKVYLNEVDVTSQIRLEETGGLASLISKIPEVRASLLARQQQFALDNSRLVAEGRDMGTVVFPQAEIKFYLDASPEEKAKRRFKELVERGVEADFDEILEQLRARDYQDKSREVAPLVAAEDAIVIDTSNLGIEETFAEMDKHLAKVFNAN